jgi:hypothetical protein
MMLGIEPENLLRDIVLLLVIQAWTRRTNDYMLHMTTTYIYSYSHTIQHLCRYIPLEIVRQDM